MSLKPWRHQTRSLEIVNTAIAQGVRRICLAIPTGGGKTYCGVEMARQYIEAGKLAIFYTSRKTLVAQSSRAFTKYGVDHGVRASGHTDQRWLPFQISSVATETRRLKAPEANRNWELHQADLVIVDECHVNSGPEMCGIMARHIEQGAVVLGLTATPLDLGHAYDRLVVGATNSELLECGSLVPAYHIGCDEPDMRLLKFKEGEDPSEKNAIKAMMNPTIYGRVLKWYFMLNEERKPTILFAPGVNESFWFAEQFYKAGVRAAHIDGNSIWVNGKWVSSTPGARDELLGSDTEPGMLRTGEVQVLTNRFVAREGLDIPEVEHIIFATIMGSIKTYLQAGGRGLRASPKTGKTRCTIQDHGGHWWRPGLGSLNSDREWHLDYSASTYAGLHEERMRSGEDKIPKKCPRCSLILTIRVCKCGFVVENLPFARSVVQIDGELLEMEEPLFKKRVIAKSKTEYDEWKSIYWGFLKTKKSDKTFREAVGWFRKKFYGRFPDPSWPYMPREVCTLFRKIKETPLSELNPDRPPAPKLDVPPCPF